MKRILRLALLIAPVLVLGGCVILGDKIDQFRWRFTTLPFFVFDNAQGYKCPDQPPVMDEPVNLAVAISGGGSRSAVFAAGVLEQLAWIKDPRRPAHSVLDSCDAISAVSAGSLAAAYYGLYKPADFCDPQATTDFFQRFKSNMTVDYAMYGWVHYVSHPWEAAMKYYARYRFVQTLANTFDQYAFAGATFGDLHKREICGESPTIIMNSASLDIGKKFLFTNLNVRQNFCVDPDMLCPKINSMVPACDRPALQLIGQITASPIYSSFGFDAIDSDICSFRLASAVAASSAYPVVPGPAALIDYCSGGYVHLADGGVNDNFGIDALVQLYMNKLQSASTPRRVVIISIDATAPLEPIKTGDPNGIVSSITYGERANTIVGTRGQTLAMGLYGAQHMIQVIPISLFCSTKVQELESKQTNLCLSERDMYTLLGAAAEVTQALCPSIQAALAGKAVGK